MTFIAIARLPNGQLVALVDQAADNAIKEFDTEESAHIALDDHILRSMPLQVLEVEV